MTAISYPLAEHTLANGLRVIVSEDHTVPNVAVNLWVGVGSRHETPGRTGFAHLFEHLMFQGSRDVASGEHFSALMDEGARLNATTWFDRTNYFETVPTGALELALWLEADRMGTLLDALSQGNLAAAPVDDDDFVGQQMVMGPDRVARRDLLIAHDEVR